MRSPLLALVATLLACGGSDGGDAADAGPRIDAADVLECTEVGWCTNWSSLPAGDLEMPATTGGEITDSTYRREEGNATASALVFFGGAVLQVGDGDNRLGTWSATGDVLTVDYATACSATSEGANSTGGDMTYAIVGDDLFTQSGDDAVVRWTRVTDLCSETAAFQCRLALCGCEQTAGTIPELGSCY